MFNRNRTKSILSGFSFSCKSLMAECKVRLIITYFLMLIGIFFGIFLAVRLNNQGILDKAGDYGYISFSIVKISSFSSFLWRFISVALIAGMLMLFSLSIFLYPIGQIVLLYRAYLIGLNIVIIILLGGFGGLFTGLLIILPCQLINLAILSTFFCIYTKNRRSDLRERLKIFGITLLLLLIMDIVESLLLLVFGANIILVI